MPLIRLISLSYQNGNHGFSFTRLFKLPKWQPLIRFCIPNLEVPGKEMLSKIYTWSMQNRINGCHFGNLKRLMQNRINGYHFGIIKRPGLPFWLLKETRVKPNQWLPFGYLKETCAKTESMVTILVLIYTCIINKNQSL